MHLPTIFEDYARDLLAVCPEISTEWEVEDGGDKKKLTIKKQDSSGFDIVVQCETYGLFPFAGEWHGPAWELWPGDETLIDLCEQFMGFVRTLLSKEASLEVRYSGGKPYKWVLSYETEEGHEDQEAGLFLYNYFGVKTSQVFQNNILPPRYEPNAI